MAGTFTLDDEQRKGPWDEMIGRSAGSYRIVRMLGKGGMGAVYLARHPGIGAQVAVKFLNPRFGSDKNHVERFFNEARAVNLIGQENIVKTLDFGVTPEGLYYFVMEFLNGQPLSALLQKPMPLAMAGPILLQICRALQAAHERQIVHRDLKPDNVFLISQMGKKHFVKIVDFGIAKLIDPGGGAGMTEAGALIGTPEYMSPEQAAGREVGRRSDVYALGVVMYQLATGRVPFRGASTAETLVAQMQAEPSSLRSIEPSVPEAYERIVLKALAKKKEDRWQSMAELHDAILSCMKELGLDPQLPPADAEPPPQPAAEMPSTDPKAPPEVPLTGTFAGDRAPLQARVERFADWAFAPTRRLRTVAALVAGVIAIALLVPRGQHVARIPPEPKPIAQPIAQPAAVAQPPVVAPTPVVQQPVPPKLKPKPARPRHVAVVEQPKPTPPAAEVPNAPTTAADAARLAATARKEREAAKKAREEMIAAAAKSAQDDAAQGKPPPGVKLFVVSDPLGASVTAAWNGKSATGVTPFVFRVRRGATVTVTLSKPGYSPEVREIPARESQAVSVDLRPAP